MIQTKVAGSVFLDLFSGSGSIGIEALSRGAKEAYFVENQKAAVLCIRENLKFTKLEENSVVMECDAVTAIRKLCGKGKIFDIIFMDPPYNMKWERNVLAALSSSDILDEDTTIIIEASLTTDFAFVEELGFAVEKEKEYKTNKHVYVYRTKKNALEGREQ